MRIVLFGPFGQIGSELSLALTNALERLDEPSDLICVSRKELNLLDLQRIDYFLEELKPDLIINASAYTKVDTAEHELELAYAINRDAVRHIASYCAYSDSRLIHISTDYVFGGSGDSPYSESSPVAPAGVYGMSKLAGENCVRELLPAHIILRTSWVFGLTGTNFVKTMIKLAAAKRDIRVVNDQWGAPTSACSIAKAVSNIVLEIAHSDSSDERWGTYHFSGFPFVTWADFASEIFEQAVEREVLADLPKVIPISTDDYKTAAIRPANSRLDCSKVKKVFDIDADDWRSSLGIVLQELKTGR